MSGYALIAPFGDDVDYQLFQTERYDASGGEPEAWQLSVILTAPDQPIIAAIAGQLSTVPPDELPPSGVPVKIPRASDGRPAATDDPGLLSQLPASTPEVTTLHLSPFASEGVLGFGDSLRSLGFGNEIRWVMYTNVDAESLRTLTLTVPRIGPLEGLTDEDVFVAFMAGEIAVAVGAGTEIGHVSETVDDGRTAFAVHTDVGYVDPVALWQGLNPLSLFGAVGTAWPFLSATSARNATVTSLWPMPVLHHARIAYALTTVQWRALGATQKDLYWARLRAKYHNGTASPFFFSRQDMANVFQLEALIEFYLAYRTPAQSGEGGVPAVPAAPVDLTDSSTAWHFVVLEPFVDLLRSPDMIGPEYALNPVIIDGVAYGPDRFDAVLFLVHDGIPKRWHRWTTYTAHTWLSEATDKDQSSIVGNIGYSFKSRNASTVSAINYAFIVYDHFDHGKEACPGKFYYDPATPIRDDADGKVEVMVHVAYTSTATNPQDYSGSAGCLVSPSFMRLRDQMLGFLSASLTWNDTLEKLRGASLAKSMDIFKADLPVLESHNGKSIIEAWNRAFEGRLWLVRPDESSHK